MKKKFKSFYKSPNNIINAKTSMRYHYNSDLFFILDVRSNIIKCISKLFIFLFFWKSSKISIHEVVDGKSLLKTSPRSGTVLWAILRPGMDPRLCMDRSWCEICLVQCRRHQRHHRHSLSMAQDSSTAVEFEYTNALW